MSRARWVTCGFLKGVIWALGFPRWQRVGEISSIISAHNTAMIIEDYINAKVSECNWTVSTNTRILQQFVSCNITLRTNYKQNSACHNNVMSAGWGAVWLRQRHHLFYHKSLHCKVKMILKLLPVVSGCYMKTMGTEFSSQVIFTGANLTSRVIHVNGLAPL